MLVKSYIPSSALPLAGVEHCCLMYTHAPSTFPSIIPLSKPLSHAHFPQAPCCPPLFIEYIFYSATFFHLSWQLQLLCRGAGGGCGGGSSAHGGHREERHPRISIARITLQRARAISAEMNKHWRWHRPHLFPCCSCCFYYLRTSVRCHRPHFTSWKNNNYPIERPPAEWSRNRDFKRVSKQRPDLPQQSIIQCHF